MLLSRNMQPLFGKPVEKISASRQEGVGWRPVAAPEFGEAGAGWRQMQPGGEALQGYGCSSHTPCLLGVTSPGLPKEGKAHAFSFFQKTEKNLRIS